MPDLTKTNVQVVDLGSADPLIAQAVANNHHTVAINPWMPEAPVIEAALAMGPARRVDARKSSASRPEDAAAARKSGEFLPI
ncbi:MAG: hypothetical protein AB7G06_07020 [Bdellovibrionales bacterium]